jgi:hypothetical protein
MIFSSFSFSHSLLVGTYRTEALDSRPKLCFFDFRKKHYEIRHCGIYGIGVLYKYGGRYRVQEVGLGRYRYLPIPTYRKLWTCLNSSIVAN